MEQFTCNGCIHFVELFKHPSNSSVFQGSISNKTGLYACLVMGKMDGKREGILFDHNPGGCEMYDNGKPKFAANEKT